jgi:hypothetical protein
MIHTTARKINSPRRSNHLTSHVRRSIWLVGEYLSSPGPDGDLFLNVRIYGPGRELSPGRHLAVRGEPALRSAEARC